MSYRTLLSLIGLLVLTATSHEAWRSSFDRPIDARTDSLAVRILHCFSALNNTRKLLSTKSSSDSFTCIHGIRLLSTTWVVMGHSWLMTYYQYNYNLITGSVKVFDTIWKNGITWPSMNLPTNSGRLQMGDASHPQRNRIGGHILPHQRHAGFLLAHERVGTK